MFGQVEPEQQPPGQFAYVVGLADRMAAYAALTDQRHRASKRLLLADVA